MEKIQIYIICIQENNPIAQFKNIRKLTTFMNFKRGFRKFWYLLWEDNSLKGWIFSLIFLFVFVKLIFFPTLNLITGTSTSLAIVESCSMYHDTNFLFFHNQNKWWQSQESKYSEYNIDSEEFKDFKMKNGFNKGDILFMTRAVPEKLEVGDIILFNANQKNPIIHRIVQIEMINNEYIFTTIGDNNPYSFTSSNNNYGIDETNIKEEQLVGKATFNIAPYLGWGKLIFQEFIRPQEERGFCKQYN